MIVYPLPILSPPAPVGARRRHADILVPETRADLSPGAVLGAPSASADRDLAGATPTQALRTRITRLVANAEDAYAHLPGWGAASKRGALARATDLERIRLKAERDVRRDPDVADVRITITRAPQGARRAFLYDVQVQDRFGRTDRFLTTGEE